MAAAEAPLADDLLVEILARVPYRSLCRFKAVSNRWRRLIADPARRHLLPRYHLHALAGFLHATRDSDLGSSSPRLTGVDATTGPPPLGIDPSASLPFLHTMYTCFSLLDTCNGLVLTHCLDRTNRPYKADYVVCNPATGEWVVLPQSGCKDMVLKGASFLGFDPAVSCFHFHVFRFEAIHEECEDYQYGSVTGMWIYSSETGHWVYKDNGWDCGFKIADDAKSVFFQGKLHLMTEESAIAVVDAEGNTWREIPTPCPYGILKFIGLYDGSLCFADANEYKCEVTIWVLGSREKEEGEKGESTVDLAKKKKNKKKKKKKKKKKEEVEWIWKHTISNVHQRGLTNVHLVHDCNINEASSTRPAGKCSMVFLVFQYGKVLLSYGIDSGEVHSNCSLERDSYTPYLPYHPFYSDSTLGS